MAPRNLTLLEKLDIPFGFVQAILGTLLTAIASPFRSRNTPKSLKRHLLLTVTRKVLTRLSPEQLQSLTGSTESNYLAWTKAQKLAPRTVTLPDIDTKAFWIGDPNAENVVLYYHGGGFAMPGGDGHFIFLSTLTQRANAAGKSIACLVLYYELAPGGQYPRQLTQAVGLLRYTTNTLKKSPGNIMLLGDSAGGNMIFGVVSHLMHPHPSISPLKLSGPLKGAILGSPVCVFDTSNDRFRTQEAQDPAGAHTIDTWLHNLLGSSKRDAYNEPLNADLQWWDGLDRVVKEILVTVASVEMMAADTRACVTKIQKAYKPITLFETDLDFHAQCTIGPALGMNIGEAADKMIDWAIERR